jgi:rRNA-processing protein FCF1/GNAT superfamily N-acetyltransferase
MPHIKLLIDTNILIAVEDPGPMDPRVALMLRQCANYSIQIHVEDATIADLDRDENVLRKAASISRAQRFSRLTEIHHPSDEFLADRFGPIRSVNDRGDVRLLATVDRGIADILVTEDVEIHRRASRAGIAERVVTIDEALTWIEKTFGEKNVHLPRIEDRVAYQIDSTDPLFETLCADYPGFPHWYDERCIRQHRRCWVARIGGGLAGLVIRKEESRAASGVKLPGEKILKLCTFKVHAPNQGEKLGEQLLKQALWYAQCNNFDVLYATAYPKHSVLVALFESFGFCATETLANGELRIEKGLYHSNLPTFDRNNVVAQARSIYPRFFEPPAVPAFVVPIRPDYHRRLFPELSPLDQQTDMFPESQEFLPGRPGNTIRKVYLCRATTSELTPGSILLFYHVKSEHSALSQRITSIGVLEGDSQARSLIELQRLTARRSVFSVDQLNALDAQIENPVRVLDFLLVGHLREPLGIEECRSNGLLNSPPQSIGRLSTQSYQRLSARIQPSYAI